MNIKLEELYSLPTRVRIATILRKAILLGKIKQGEELSLTAIANQLNVSRTPVREAFQILESENLIELRMNKGAVVKSVDKNFFKDNYEVRLILEEKALEKAIENNIDISYLEKIHEEFKNIVDYCSEDEYKKYNENFHFYIWKQAKNEKLFSLLLNLWNGTVFGLTSKRKDMLLSLEEHETIILALKEKNLSKANSCIKEHLNKSLENLLKSENF